MLVRQAGPGLLSGIGVAHWDSLCGCEVGLPRGDDHRIWNLQDLWCVGRPVLFGQYLHGRQYTMPLRQHFGDLQVPAMWCDRRNVLRSQQHVGYAEVHGPRGRL